MTGQGVAMTSLNHLSVPSYTGSLQSNALSYPSGSATGSQTLSGTTTLSNPNNGPANISNGSQPYSGLDIAGKFSINYCSAKAFLVFFYFLVILIYLPLFNQQTEIAL